MYRHGFYNLHVWEHLDISGHFGGEFHNCETQSCMVSLPPSCDFFFFFINYFINLFLYWFVLFRYAGMPAHPFQCRSFLQLINIVMGNLKEITDQSNIRLSAAYSLQCHAPNKSIDPKLRFFSTLGWFNCRFFVFKRTLRKAEKGTSMSKPLSHIQHVPIFENCCRNTPVFKNCIPNIYLKNTNKKWEQLLQNLMKEQKTRWILLSSMSLSHWM